MYIVSLYKAPRPSRLTHSQTAKIMALVRKPAASSSSAARDGINPGKIKVQMIRIWKGDKNESGNSVVMVLLDSSVWFDSSYICSQVDFATKCLQITKS